MENIIDLWDIAPNERYCTQADIDDLIACILSKEVKAPPYILCINPYNIGAESGDHFTQGSVLSVVCTLQIRPTAKNLDYEQIFIRTINYDKFIRRLLEYMEDWLHDLPAKPDGRIDVDNFSILQVRRLLNRVLD